MANNLGKNKLLVVGLWFWLALCVPLSAQRASSQPFDWDLISKQFLVEQFTTSNGLPVNSANYIVHHTDGFLYIATNDGLVRYDGDKFVVYSSSSHPAIQSNRILWVSDGRSQTLSFVDINGNMYFLENGEVSWLQQDSRFSHVVVHKTNVTEKGTIILDTNVGFIEKKDGSSPQFYSNPATRIDPENSYGMEGERVDFLTKNGWFILENGTVDTLFLATELRIDIDQIFNMLRTDDGAKWVLGMQGQLLRVGTDRSQKFYNISTGSIWDAKEFGRQKLLLNTSTGYHVFDTESGKTTPTNFVASSVEYFEDNAWSKLGRSTTYLFNNSLWIDEVPVLTSERNIPFLTSDKNGNVWVATSGDGVYKISPKHMITLGSDIHPDLENVYGMDVFNSELWATSFEGTIFNVTDSKIRAWSLSKSPENASFFRSVKVGDASKMYVGNFELWKSDGETWKRDSSFPKQEDLLDVIFEDYQGRIWIGTRKETFVLDGSNFIPFVDSVGATLGGITSVLSLADGRLVFSTVGKGVALLRENTVLHFISTEQGLSSNIIRDVIQTGKDTLWAASEDKGLNRIILVENSSNSRITSVGARNGLSDNSLHSVVLDEFGYLWINSNSGIMRIHLTELNAYLDGKGKKLSVQTFLERDGLSNSEGNGGTQNSGILTDDGKLFFANQAGIVYTKPEWHIDQAGLLAPVFESISFEDSTLNVMNLSAVSLSNKFRNISVTFTLPHLEQTHNVSLQYRLQGVHQEWQDASSDRVAVFTNLPSGSRKIELRGRQKGTDNYSQASLSITIAPYFYETTSFFFLVGLFLIGVFYSGYRYLLFQSKQREKKLEHQVAERTKELVAEKEKTEEALEVIKKLDASKSEFFTNFTHELRTPLSLILSPLEEMLESDVQPTKDKHAPLALMMRSATRLKNLVNQLLDISKLSSGELSLKYEAVHIASLTSQLCAQFSHSFAQKNINFSTHFDGNIQPIDLDVSAWEHICTNLIGNALKFTPDGGSISVRIQNLSDSISISFSDSGCGIAKRDLPFIFDPYFQGDSATAKANGTGIGLAFVKGLVEKMGGTIRVSSELRKGTRFEIGLPKGDKHLSGEDSMLVDTLAGWIKPKTPQYLAEEEFETDFVIPSDAPRILLVEDNPDFRAYVASLLARHYHVSTAKNGREGLEKIDEINPNLIISDIMMPEMNGYEMMQHIRQQASFARIPFIFLSAKDSDEDIRRGLNLGADIYLTKPVHNKLLLTQVKALLRREALMNSVETENEPQQSALVKETSELIQRHLGNPELNVEMIAQSMAISSATLYRNWRGESEISINQLITKFRLEEARKLMKEEGFNVSEAAFAVGYKHSSHFSRAFKKAYGISPKEYAN